MTASLTFPNGFKWGGATSAQQVEGALLEDGAGRSMWYGFARTPGHIVGGDLQDVACDHYHRYADDVAIMRDLGLNAYQFSVSWARVLPDGHLRAVNSVGVEDYLAGVIGHEMPIRWSDAALQAQTIAARTYALTNLRPGDDHRQRRCQSALDGRSRPAIRGALQVDQRIRRSAVTPAGGTEPQPKRIGSVAEDAAGRG